MITVEYRCSDGTPFPVTFESDADADRPWALEREHNRPPLSPLADALERLGTSGRERAYGEAGLPVPGFFRTGPLARGFPYYCTAPPTDEEMGALFGGCAALIADHGSAEGIWRGYALPRIRAVCETLQAAGPDDELAPLADAQVYGQHLTMIPAFVTGNDMRLLAAVCGEVRPDQGDIVANELAQGYPSETLRADQALWDLGRQVRESPSLAGALRGSDPAPVLAGMRARDEETAFFGALDAFLDEFGWRSELWQIDVPTWRELGPGFLAQLRQMARDDAKRPDDAVRAAAVRRVSVAAEIDGLLAGDDDRRSRFHRRVARVAPYVAVREERAHWQLALVGSLRHAVLRHGGALASRGAIERAEDVLYLLPEEVEGTTGDLSGVVAERRASHDALTRLDPPLVLQAPDGEHPDAAAPGEGSVHGVGASRGRVTGRARVITQLADADRVEPGDVLVCVTTSPPWTPLFGLIGAVVVDSGDMGSHPAIAAREYGIPCVLGTATGTTMIPDGALVTVDGDTGTVVVLPGA